jgi:hypothetical protein
VLCGDAAQFILALALAGVGRFTARVADRLKERLALRPAAAPETAPACERLDASRRELPASRVHGHGPGRTTRISVLVCRFIRAREPSPSGA